MSGGMPGMDPAMGMASAMPGMSGGMPGMDPAMGMMPGMGMGMGMGMMPGMGMPKSKEKDITTLTRTDFKIEFVWQPLTPEEAPKTPEEAQTKLAEYQKSMREAAEKNKGSVRAFDESKLQELSLKESEAAKTKAIQQIQQVMQKAAGSEGQPAADANGTAPAAATPGETEK